MIARLLLGLASVGVGLLIAVVTHWVRGRTRRPRLLDRLRNGGGW